MADFFAFSNFTGKKGRWPPLFILLNVSKLQMQLFSLLLKKSVVLILLIWENVFVHNTFVKHSPAMG